MIASVGWLLALPALFHLHVQAVGPLSNRSTNVFFEMLCPKLSSSNLTVVNEHQSREVSIQTSKTLTSQINHRVIYMLLLSFNLISVKVRENSYFCSPPPSTRWSYFDHPTGSRRPFNNYPNFIKCLSIKSLSQIRLIDSMRKFVEQNEANEKAVIRKKIYKIFYKTSKKYPRLPLAMSKKEHRTQYSPVHRSGFTFTNWSIPFI